jgi:magnesium-transporting ATPase (P-type)
MPDGKLRAFINGAPDVLLERCTKLYTSTGVRPLTDADRQNILAQNTALAQQALRVLGSAWRDLEFSDPVATDVSGSFAQIRASSRRYEYRQRPHRESATSCSLD